MRMLKAIWECCPKIAPWGALLSHLPFAKLKLKDWKDQQLQGWVGCVRICEPGDRDLVRTSRVSTIWHSLSLEIRVRWLHLGSLSSTLTVVNLMKDCKLPIKTKLKCTELSKAHYNNIKRKESRQVSLAKLRKSGKSAQMLLSLMLTIFWVLMKR